MGAAGGRADGSVAELLFEEGFRFEFHQAVRLLEILRPDAEPLGQGHDPAAEAVRFRSRVGLDFPAADVVQVSRPEDERAPAEMAVAFLGAAGGLSPLPRPFTELVLERTARKDTALRDFLDIFNHRLVSLMYRVRKKHRIGLGTPGLRGRLGVDDRSLLAYAGLLAQRPRSMVALEQLLTDYFGVPVDGEQLRGRWLVLDEEQRTRIGRLGENHALGGGAVLGGRFWDQQGTFELRVGPLSRERFLDFLPPGTAFGPLCELARFHAGTELDFTVRLVLRAEEVPASRLGGARLGWTSWLKTQPRTEEGEVRLSPR